MAEQEHVEEEELGNGSGGAHDLRPLAETAEFTAPEDTAAAENVEQMTPASWLQWCLQAEGIGEQWQWELCDPGPASFGKPLTLAPCPQQ